MGEFISENGFSSGNKLTKQMLFLTKKELSKPNTAPNFSPKKVSAEKSVLIQKKGFREGKFDFLVESFQGKTIGVEVLTRPSKGKLKQKLAYAKEVDEFIFVLPTNSLELYKKKKTNPLPLSARKKFLPPCFSSKKLFVWLLNPQTNKFFSKNVFSNEFNTAK